MKHVFVEWRRKSLRDRCIGFELVDLRLLLMWPIAHALPTMPLKVELYEKHNASEGEREGL